MSTVQSPQPTHKEGLALLPVRTSRWLAPRLQAKKDYGEINGHQFISKCLGAKPQPFAEKKQILKDITNNFNSLAVYISNCY